MKAGPFDRLSDVAYEDFIKETKALSGYTKQLVTKIDAGVGLPCALIEAPREATLRHPRAGMS